MGKLVTVKKLINDDTGTLREHVITVDADAFMGSMIEYGSNKAILVISLGSDTLVLRVPVNQELYLRNLNDELIEAVKMGRNV